MKARTLPSLEPTKTTPLATLGEEKTTPVVVPDHFVAPVVASSP